MKATKAAKESVSGPHDVVLAKGRPRTVTNQMILEAARHCAMERGPNVALDVIAARIGVTSPALLKRFGSRQRLMIAALRPTDPPVWVLELGLGPDNRPLELQLALFMGRVFDFFTREMPCMTALSESGFPIEEIFKGDETPPPFRNLWALSSWLEQAQARGLIAHDAVQDNDFESVAMGILGALHSRVFLSDFMGTTYWRRSRDQYIRDLAGLYARALSPTAATRDAASPTAGTASRSRANAVVAKQDGIKLAPQRTPRKRTKS
jgi:AcrR family transcriptional regulator